MAPMVVAAMLATDPGFAGPPPDLEHVMCQAARQLQLAEQRISRYEYRKDDVEMKTQGERVVERKTTTRFIHRSRPDGVAINEIVAHDGRPLPPDEAADEARYVRTRTAEIRLDPDEVRKHLAKSAEKSATLGAIARAFDLELLGLDWIDGEPCWVIFFHPSPGFRPQTKTEKYLENFQGVAWARVRDPVLLRVEADFINSMSAKWGPLATIKKGSYMKFETFEIAPGVTLTRSLELDLKLRIFFFVPKRVTRGTYYREHERVITVESEMVP